MISLASLARPRPAGRFARALATLAGLASGAPAAAERPLTYREALEAALEANPSLRRAEIGVSQAQASVIGARGIFDPNYQATASWRRSRSRDFFQGFQFESESRSWSLESSVEGSLPTGTSYSVGGDLTRDLSEFDSVFGGPDSEPQVQDSYRSNLRLSITQQLLEGVRYRYNLRNVTQARQGLTVAELGRERARQDLLKQTAEAYWNWVYLARSSEIARGSVQVAEEALRVGQLKVAAGELAPVEQTRLEAALVQAQANLLEAESNLEQAANTVLLAMGEGPGQEILPATEPGEVPALELDVAEATEVALAQNLDLAVARANLGTAELEVLDARHARLPSLAATASTGVGAVSPSSAEQGAPGNLEEALTGLFGENRQPFVSIAGTFRVPIGNRSARGGVDAASATEMQRRVELEELERSVTAQVEQQVRILASARRRVELADVNLKLAEETLRAEEALAEAGRAIQKDVLEARSEVDRLRAEAAKSRTDYRAAQAELLRLQGQLSVEMR